jgi:GntR family transcriptional regulator/MocR family aminotransferase
MELALTLDHRSAKPLHRQLYDELRGAILSGRLKPGERVPATRECARSHAVSRTTVTLSYRLLVSEGYLQSSVGSGTFVSGELPDDLLRANPVAKAHAAAKPPAAPAVHLSRYGASIADPVPFEPPEHEAPITFKSGRPALEEFPLEVWRRLILKHCRAPDRSFLDYADGAQGHQPLREAIARHLGRARAVTCNADQIIIVNGAQQAIDLIAKLLVDRGDWVAVENPGYLGVTRAMQAHGARLLPVPVDASGLQVSTLARSAKPRPKLVYVTPSHQYPTGSILTLPRRLELLAWAAKMGVVLVEDDYDSEFRFGSRPIPALQGLPGEASVIYVGTLSKVLFPALRLGYLVVPPSLTHVVARAKWLADRQAPTIDQMVLADFINQGHLERHLRRMRTLYDRRRQALVHALATHFGDRAATLGGSAGMHLVIRLRCKPDDEELIRRARAAGVALVSTRLNYLGDEWGRPINEFVLGYAGLSERRIQEGVRRLAEIAH